MNTKSEIYKEGYQAAFSGLSNPYSERTEQWIEWEYGYLDSMKENEES